MTARYIYVIFFLINTYTCKAEVKISDITTAFVEGIINENFKECKNKPLISSSNNSSSIFNNGHKIFEITTENFIVEKDFTVNAPRKFFVKYFDKNKNEIINLKSNQVYYYKKKNLIIFIGDIQLKSIVSNSDIYTSCLIYDIDSDAFFNTHTTDIKTKDATINGSKLYIKRDLSYIKLTLNYIKYKHNL